MTVVCGEEDEYVGYERFRQQEELLAQHEAVVSRLSFTGGHTLNEAVLRKLAAG